GPEPTRLTLLSNHEIVTPLQESPPVRFYDEAFAQELSIHQYGLELRLRIRVALNHPLGYDKIQANLAYQICDNRICAPLQTQILATPIIVQSDS
ncbi:MAG: hypothetical protein CL921_08630, partial [Deltaproteobacteria bacterium]|nr:hypothetical protein [Deltaproteobacteria bacterium]